jgi:hypothetical protein
MRKPRAKPLDQTDRFIKIDLELSQTVALRSVAVYALRAWLCIRHEFFRTGRIHNGRLQVSFDRFTMFGVRRNAIGPALAELEAVGLIVVTRFAGLIHGSRRRPNLYRLCDQPNFDEAGPTRDYRRFEPSDDTTPARTEAEAFAKAEIRKARRQWRHSEGASARCGVLRAVAQREWTDLETVRPRALALSSRGGTGSSARGGTGSSAQGGTGSSTQGGTGAAPSPKHDPGQ